MTSRPEFTSRPRTVVARLTDGRLVPVGTFANYFLALPVVEAAERLANVARVELLTHLPAAV